MSSHLLRSLLHLARRALVMRLRGPKLLFSQTPSTRCQNHWRRIVRRILGDRVTEVGLRGPVAPEARRRRAAVLRLDFLTADARLAAGLRIIIARVLRWIGELDRPVDDDTKGRTRKAPVAPDHGAIDDHTIHRDRHADLARNGDHRSGLRVRRRRECRDTDGSKNESSAHEMPMAVP